VRLRTRTVWLVVLGVALLAALFWPTPDPFANVETVALASPEGRPLDLPGQVLDGLELALGERRIVIVSDPEQADAVITIEPQSAEIRIDEQGLRARVRGLLTKDGQRYVLDLYVTLDEEGLRAKLVTKRPWELWAERLTRP